MVTKTTKGKTSGIRRLLWAAAVAALAVFVAAALGVEAVGGVGLPGGLGAWSLGALLVILGALATVGKASGTASKSLGAAGVGGLFGGVAAYALSATEFSTGLLSAGGIAVGAGVVISFLLASASAKPKAARVVVFVLYITLAVCAGMSLGQPRVWEGVFAFEGQAEEGVAVPSDVGGQGSGVQFERVNLDGDWRNAAVVEPEGFFYEEVDLHPGDVLRFSASVRGTASGKMVITAAGKESKDILWESDTAVLAAGKWTEIKVPIAVDGLVNVVYELSGATAGTKALFANYRVETGATVTGAVTRKDTAKGPNVILMVVDCLRRDRLSLMGYGKRTSPEIDELAKRGVVFEECIAPAPWTKPSMGTIFTGLYPSAHRVEAQDNILQNTLETVAEVFQRSGYRTCAIQGNATLEVERGFAQGFDVYKMFRLRSPTPDDPGIFPSAGVVNDSALEWVDENAGSAFFLYMHFMDCHSPYWPPAGFRDFGDEPSERYDAGISYFSNEFEKFYSELEKRGLVENSIIVLTADHGEQFMEHGATEHGNCLHIEEVAVPLLVWGPGAAAGRRVSERVGLIDVPETVLEMAGLGGLADAQGESFASAVKGGEIESREVLSELLTYVMPGYKYVSITGDKWRFIYETRMHDAELYERANDVGEYRNRAESNAELAVGLRRRAEEHLDTQYALAKRVAPRAAQAELSEEEIQKLTAMGYLNRGADAGGE